MQVLWCSLSPLLLCNFSFCWRGGGVFLAALPSEPQPESHHRHFPEEGTKVEEGCTASTSHKQLPQTRVQLCTLRPGESLRALGKSFLTPAHQPRAWGSHERREGLCNLWFGFQTAFSYRVLLGSSHRDTLSRKMDLDRPLNTFLGDFIGSLEVMLGLPGDGYTVYRGRLPTTKTQILAREVHSI